MSSRLPVKIQMGIRDSWTSASSPVQKAISKLKTTLGLRVDVNPEWPLLLSELDPFYPDKATFVPSVAGTVEAFCVALAALVDDAEDKGNEALGEELLEKVEGVVRIYLEVSKDRELSLAWSPQQRGFIIKLARAPCPSRSYAESLFAGALTSPSFFSVEKQQQQQQTKPSAPSPAASTSPNPAAAADDWADISYDNATGKAAVIDVPVPLPLHTRPTTTTNSNILTTRERSDQINDVTITTVIPDVDTVPRPDDLLLRPPYHLTVTAYGKGQIEVECSHSPTLQFLSEYLKKWCRTNHHRTDNPPQAEINLHQSAFGLGIIYDRLTIACEQRYAMQTITPTVVLALVEGVLGYRSVVAHASSSSWSFRRDVELRTSR